jgi:hypothetical protein
MNLYILEGCGNYGSVPFVAVVAATKEEAIKHAHKHDKANFSKESLFHSMIVLEVPLDKLNEVGVIDGFEFPW